MMSEDLLKMARDAGFSASNPHSKFIVRHSNGSRVDIEQELVYFANLVANAKREQCAKIADKWAEEDDYLCASGIAADIRSRG